MSCIPLVFHWFHHCSVLQMYWIFTFANFFSATITFFYLCQLFQRHHTFFSTYANFFSTTIPFFYLCQPIQQHHTSFSCVVKTLLRPPVLQSAHVATDANQFSSTEHLLWALTLTPPIFQSGTVCSPGIATACIRRTSRSNFGHFNTR